MKTDLYTRTVLTVIAACLLWLCVNSLTPTASAQAPQAEIQKVMLVDSRGLSVIGATGLRVNFGELPVPVNVAMDKNIPVVIRGIERAGAVPWEPIQVDVLKAAPTSMPTP
jgi:hypothetical protein